MARTLEELAAVLKTGTTALAKLIQERYDEEQPGDESNEGKFENLLYMPERFCVHTTKYHSGGINLDKIMTFASVHLRALRGEPLHCSLKDICWYKDGYLFNNGLLGFYVALLTFDKKEAATLIKNYKKMDHGCDVRCMKIDEPSSLYEIYNKQESMLQATMSMRSTIIDSYLLVVSAEGDMVKMNQEAMAKAQPKPFPKMNYQTIAKYIGTQVKTLVDVEERGFKPKNVEILRRIGPAMLDQTTISPLKSAYKRAASLYTDNAGPLQSLKFLDSLPLHDSGLVEWFQEYPISKVLPKTLEECTNDFALHKAVKFIISQIYLSPLLVGQRFDIGKAHVFASKSLLQMSNVDESYRKLLKITGDLYHTAEYHQILIEMGLDRVHDWKMFQDFMTILSDKGLFSPEEAHSWFDKNTLRIIMQQGEDVDAAATNETDVTSNQPAVKLDPTSWYIKQHFETLSDRQEVVGYRSLDALNGKPLNRLYVVNAGYMSCNRVMGSVFPHQCLVETKNNMKWLEVATEHIKNVQDNKFLLIDNGASVAGTALAAASKNLGGMTGKRSTGSLVMTKSSYLSCVTQSSGNSQLVTAFVTNLSTKVIEQSEFYDSHTKEVEALFDVAQENMEAMKAEEDRQCNGQARSKRNGRASTSEMNKAIKDAETNVRCQPEKTDQPYACGFRNLPKWTQIIQSAIRQLGSNGDLCVIDVFSCPDLVASCVLLGVDYMGFTASAHHAAAVKHIAAKLALYYSTRTDEIEDANCLISLQTKYREYCGSADEHSSVGFLPYVVTKRVVQPKITDFFNPLKKKQKVGDGAKHAATGGNVDKKEDMEEENSAHADEAGVKGD